MTLATAAAAVWMYAVDVRHDPPERGCPSVDVSFARGTGEREGLGGVGDAFTASLQHDVRASTMSVYAVRYAAAVNQTSVARGASDLVKHVAAEAAACPRTQFVLAGYSQGASVISYAIGLLGRADTTAILPAGLAPRVKAVVVFGNPLGLTHSTIETRSSTYGAVARSYCAPGDPVCGAGLNVLAHRAYVADGFTAQAARFVAGRVA